MTIYLLALDTDLLAKPIVENNFDHAEGLFGSYLSRGSNNMNGEFTPSTTVRACVTLRHRVLVFSQSVTANKVADAGWQQERGS